MPLYTLSLHLSPCPALPAIKPHPTPFTLPYPPLPFFWRSFSSLSFTFLILSLSFLHLHIPFICSFNFLISPFLSFLIYPSPLSPSLHLSPFTYHIPPFPFLPLFFHVTHIPSLCSTLHCYHLPINFSSFHSLPIPFLLCLFASTPSFPLYPFSTLIVQHPYRCP